MKSKFLLTILSVVTVSAVTTAQTKSEVSESQPNTVDYEQELYLQNILYGSSNPVSIANNPYTVINSFDGYYSRVKGDFKPIDGAGNANLMDFNIYGAKKLKKISFEGTLQYSVHELNKSRWGNTVLLSPKNPFIIADSLVYDSVPNNHDREIFNLNGGFAWQTTDRLTLGLRANYKVGSKADQSDPRFESHAARVTVNPGVQYKMGSLALGLSGSYETYHELIRMTVQDNLLDPAHDIIFLFNELGNYTIMNVTGYNRLYNGTKYTGALQAVYSGSSLANFLEVEFVSNKEEAIDGGTSYRKLGGENTNTTLNFTDRLQFRGASMQHNIGISASMLNEKAKFFKQNARHDNFGMEVWDVVSAEITQKEKDLKADLSYRLDMLKDGESHLTAIVKGGIDKVTVNEYPDEYFVKYTLMNAGVDLTKRFDAGNYRFAVSANGTYCKALDALEYELPTENAGKRRFTNNYFAPKYQYFGAEYISYGVSASAAYRIRNRQLVKLTAGYSFADYKGEYSRFDNRSNLFVKLAYTL